MKKVDKIKEDQGFVKNHPCCGNCVNFTSKRNLSWSTKRESCFRCNLGNFKVGKSSWCRLHQFVEK